MHQLIARCLSSHRGVPIMSPHFSPLAKVLRDSHYPRLCNYADELEHCIVKVVLATPYTHK